MGACGIGREIARAEEASGSKLFVCDIDAKDPDDLTREIPGLTTEVPDVSRREDI